MCTLAGFTLSYIPRPTGQVVKRKRESKSVQGSGGKILMMEKSGVCSEVGERF